jgi:farnesyl diphosphate synthase
LTGAVADRAAAAVSMTDWMAATTVRVEAVLERALGRAQGPAPILAEAMRYAVMAGGKRVRPLLVHAAAELGEAPASVVDGCAAAVELIHTYSLIHDDLPCMDDDDLRRGRPTTHRVHGEAQALLAGDALQSLAFEVLVDGFVEGPGDAAGRPVPVAAFVSCLARAAGPIGMAGGQSIDLASVGRRLTAGELETMHRMKTGALMRASILLGTMAAGLTVGEQAAVERFADRIGLAFQVVDDVLDVASDSATLGKTAGKDAANDKPTYVSLMGLEPARRLVVELRSQAQAALEPFGRRGHRLSGLADLIVDRVS